MNSFDPKNINYDILKCRALVYSTSPEILFAIINPASS